jgi:hypothetical protein
VRSRRRRGHLLAQRLLSEALQIFSIKNVARKIPFVKFALAQP